MAKILKAKVVSDKLEKTIVVLVSSLRKHPKYKKYYLRTKKYKVNDPNKQAKQGDLVLIQETRPISKDKHFKLVKILTTKSQAPNNK